MESINAQIMKNSYHPIPFLFIIMIILSSSAITSAQVVYEDPIPITDSISDNTNPLIVHSGNTTLIFYEKTRDNGFTSIYMQDMDELHQEIVLFSEEDINYRNPQAIVFNDWPNQPDTLFYLFFESDMESAGYYNIYYTKYSQDGSFTEPIAMDISYTSCEHLRICNNNLVWERGGNIEYCFLEYDGVFSETQTLDFDDCKNPEVGNASLAYQKMINDSLKVYFSEYLYEIQDWSEPEIIYNHSTEASIVVLNSDMEGGGDHGVIWESQVENNYQLISYENWGEDWDTMAYISSIPMQSTFLSYEIFLDEVLYPYITDLALVKDDNGNHEIYVNSWWGGINDLYNISNSTENESHPKLQYFSKNYSYNVVLFWQSTQNNHQQLFMTKSTFWLNTNDLAAQENTISIFPNPTSTAITAELNLAEPQKITIDLFNMEGYFCGQLFNNTLPKGPEVLQLDLPNHLTNGTYYLHLKSIHSNVTKKLVLLK